MNDLTANPCLALGVSFTFRCPLLPIVLLYHFFYYHVSSITHIIELPAASFLALRCYCIFSPSLGTNVRFS